MDLPVVGPVIGLNLDVEKENVRGSDYVYERTEGLNLCLDNPSKAVLRGQENGVYAKV